jgi:hypothetical protein
MARFPQHTPPSRHVPPVEPPAPVEPPPKPKPRIDPATASIPDLIIACHAAFRDDLVTQANANLGQALLAQGPFTATINSEYNVVYSYLDSPPFWRRTPLPEVRSQL